VSCSLDPSVAVPCTRVAVPCVVVTRVWVATYGIDSGVVCCVGKLEMVCHVFFVFWAPRRRQQRWSKWLHVVPGRRSPPTWTRRVTGEAGENDQSSGAVSERRTWIRPSVTPGEVSAIYRIRVIAINWVIGRSGCIWQ